MGKKRVQKTKLSAVSVTENSDEIDSLFESLKSKKKMKKEDEDEQQVVILEKKNKKVKVTESFADDNSMNNIIISPEPPVHRRDTESGLPVYKAHLLKVGEGGGTKLCPFDCKCCF